MLAQLRAAKLAVLAPVEPASRISAATKRAKLKIERRSRISADEALNLGRGAAQDDTYHELKERGPAAARHLADGAWIADRSPKSPAPLADYPSIEVHALATKLFKPGLLTGQSLGWSLDVVDGEFITVFVDARDVTMHPSVIFAIHSKDLILRWQLIDMVPRAGVTERWCFICPIERIPTQALYLRNGRFAGRVAQRLHHRSQRRAGN